MATDLFFCGSGHHGHHGGHEDEDGVWHLGLQQRKGSSLQLFRLAVLSYNTAVWQTGNA